MDSEPVTLADLALEVRALKEEILLLETFVRQARDAALGSEVIVQRLWDEATG